VDVTRRTARGLLATSPEIEREPLWRRPRFTAATWGGLLACKAYAMAFVSFEAGLVAFTTVLLTGGAITILRFGLKPAETSESRAIASAPVA
jgi:hypothetical protein